MSNDPQTSTSETAIVIRRLGSRNRKMYLLHGLWVSALLVAVGFFVMRGLEPRVATALKWNDNGAPAKIEKSVATDQHGN